MKKHITLLIIVVGCLFLKIDGYAFTAPTHNKIITSIIYDNSWIYSPKFQSYGLPQGMETIINGTYVKNYIENGGESEDNFPRYFNHFHDPTQGWLSSGFKGNPGQIWDSLPVWAQKTNQAVGTPGFFYEGNYSWPAARNYFYNALTALNKTDRDNNFEKCFRAIGQLMHLVQDAAVPAHVRNESHATGNNFETYIGSLSQNSIDTLIHATVFVPYSGLTSRVGYNTHATIPIAGLFDTDQYTGQNPMVTTGNNIGLTEYVNANFFSENSVFKSYTYPSMNSVVLDKVCYEG